MCIKKGIIFRFKKVIKNEVHFAEVQPYNKNVSRDTKLQLVIL